jgi:hypothetical protein
MFMMKIRIYPLLLFGVLAAIFNSTVAEETVVHDKGTAICRRARVTRAKLSNQRLTAILAVRGSGPA